MATMSFPQLNACNNKQLYYDLVHVKIERDYNEKGEDVKTEKKNGKVDNVTTYASNVLMSS